MLKTGAIICKKPDDENGMIYEAILFIKDIPAHITDDDLKKKIVLTTLKLKTSACPEILFRADIHSTSNAVQEQFENLHPPGKHVPEINFNSLTK